MEHRNPAGEYVRLAIQIMQLTTSGAELVRWWLEESDHRRHWKLSPTQWPGLDLKEAFDKRRAELKQGD